MPYADAVATAKSSVVRIETNRGHGSGIAVGPRAALTNAHVVDRATVVRLTDHLGNQFRGHVVWRNAQADLAVVRVLDTDLDPIEVGNPAEVREGNEVIALGHPLGLSFTATKGIISAKDREFRGQRFIQVDAPLNPGCSGGPLLDRNGRAIGVNTFLMTGGESLGFAIAIDRALSSARMAIDQCETHAVVCCPACGKNIFSESRYCSICGTRLDAMHVSMAMPMDAGALLVAHSATYQPPAGKTAPLGQTESVTRVRQMINVLLDSLEIDSYDARRSRDHWEFELSGQRMEVGLMTEPTRPERAMVYVRAMVARVPIDQVLPFYRRLLETNEQLVGMPAFCVDAQNTVWMSTSRPIEGLDAGELHDLLLRTNTGAEKFGGELIAEFGGEGG